MAFSVTVLLLGFALTVNCALGQTDDESVQETELRRLLTRILENTIRNEEASVSDLGQASSADDFVVSSMAESKSTGQISSMGKMSGTPKNNTMRPLDLSNDCLANAPYRRIDGRCNNPTIPERGSTQQPFKRLLDPVYDDGISIPRLSGKDGNPLPSPRAVSTAIHADKNRKSSDNTVLVMQWGQFIDHDLTATPVHGDEVNISCCDNIQSGQLHPDVRTGGPCFPITIPENDRRFQKNCMEFKRSTAAPERHTREQINLLTSFLDASMVYGLNEEQTSELRDGPYLKTRGNDLLPESSEPICRLDNDDDWCFAAGDDRVNVFPGLSVMHTVFMREHNRLVRELSDIFPDVTPEDVIFEEARKIVSAILQHITYNEWLPVVLGPEAMARFRLSPGTPFVYDGHTDPTIANVFATAALRYGHSTIPGFLRIRGRKIFLKDLFYRPTEVIRDLDSVLEALLEDKRQNVNRFVTDMMTDRLFETSEKDSFDIVSLNIQRGRDHGLPSYNSFRRACNLEPVTTFENEIFQNGGKAFSKVYSDPDDIDVFCGAIAEKTVNRGAVGPLLACLIGKQFEDIKYGDSHWYETTDPVKGFTEEQLTEIKRMSLAKVLCDNSGLEEIQRDPLKVYSRKKNPMVPCCDLPTIDLNQWLP